jgi:hypothetical protein
MCSRHCPWSHLGNIEARVELAGFLRGLLLGECVDLWLRWRNRLAVSAQVGGRRRLCRRPIFQAGAEAKLTEQAYERAAR